MMASMNNGFHELTQKDGIWVKEKNNGKMGYTVYGGTVNRGPTVDCIN